MKSRDSWGRMQQRHRPSWEDWGKSTSMNGSRPGTSSTKSSSKTKSELITIKPSFRHESLIYDFMRDLLIAIRWLANDAYSYFPLHIFWSLTTKIKILQQSPILNEFTPNVADTNLVIFIFHNSPKQTRRQLIRSRLELKAIPSCAWIIHENLFHPELRYQRQSHQVPIIDPALNLVQIVAFFETYHVLLEVRYWVWIGLNALVTLALFAGVKELHQTWRWLGICPNVDLNDFAFLDILEDSFVWEKYRIGHDLSFFEGVTLRNDPPLDLSFLVWVFLLIVLFAVFHHSFITLFVFVLLRFVLRLDFFFDGDKFSQFGKFIFELLCFFESFLKLELIFLKRLKFLVPLPREKFDFFVGLLMLFFQLGKLVFSRLPLLLSDLMIEIEGLIGRRKVRLRLLARIVLIILFA